MGPEYKTAPLRILDISQQVLKEKYVSGTRVVTVSRKYVECVHNTYHCVHHTIHELSDDTSVRVLLTCGPIDDIGGAVHLGQWWLLCVGGVWEVLVLCTCDVRLFDDKVDHTMLIHIVVGYRRTLRQLHQ